MLQTSWLLLDRFEKPPLKLLPLLPFPPSRYWRFSELEYKVSRLLRPSGLEAAAFVTRGQKTTKQYVRHCCGMVVEYLKSAGSLGTTPRKGVVKWISHKAKDRTRGSLVA